MNNISIDNGKEFNFGNTSEYYAKYRDIYPDKLFEKLYALGIGKANIKWLDIGTGTGVLPRKMAHFGAYIVGVDISNQQIKQAKSLSNGFDNIKYFATEAEKMNFEDNSFDCITACQCFWYFEPKIIVSQIKRLIKSGGVFAKIYMDWAADDEICNQSQQIVKKLNPSWTSGEAANKDLAVHYFDNPQIENFVVNIPFTRESWHGRMMASRGVLGSMDNKTVNEFQAQHKDFLSKLPEKFTVKHTVNITSYKIIK